MPHPEILDHVGERTFVLIPVKTHLRAPQDPDFALICCFRCKRNMQECTAHDEICCLL